ncbi:MAG: hypothetical protein KDK28_00060 [Maritimibacter sp.]|nr:hypothetical protein [Maritimibacter sp.]
MDKDLNGRLVTEVVAAIDDPAGWKRVLSVILDLAGAKAGIITLRENRTCQIVDDAQLQQEHHSPFVEGFELERVAYYIYNLRQKDVWAQAQITHRPLVPTRMSTLVSSEEFGQTELGQWCLDQGINDTIVVQIGQVPGFWTALNVFFDGKDPGCAERILGLLNDHLALLKSAWKTGRDVVRTRQTGHGLLAFLSEQGIAACLLDNAGAMTADNEKFRELREKGVVKVSIPSNRITLSDNIERKGMSPTVSAVIGVHDGESGDPAYRIMMRPIPTDPLYEGIREPELMLLLEPVEGEDTELPHRLGPRLSALTEQERDIFDAVARGLSIPDAGGAIGVKRSRAFEIWGTVKEKLGLKNANQVRVYNRR